MLIVVVFITVYLVKEIFRKVYKKKTTTFNFFSQLILPLCFALLAYFCCILIYLAVLFISSALDMPLWPDTSKGIENAIVRAPLAFIISLIVTFNQARAHNKQLSLDEVQLQPEVKLDKDQHQAHNTDYEIPNYLFGSISEQDINDILNIKRAQFYKKSNTSKFIYKKNYIVDETILKYEDELIISCITGITDASQTKELNSLINDIIFLAEIADNSFCYALTCFIKHKEPSNEIFPVELEYLYEDGFEIFVDLLNNNINVGLSESVKQYLQSNKSGVVQKANEGNPSAQWLMGAWYAVHGYKSTRLPDNSMLERMFWFESSAFGNYLPAVKLIADFYYTKVTNNFSLPTDPKEFSLPTDLKKSAYWYRVGALAGDSICAYKLGAMYAQGEGIIQNIEIAKMWLSLSWKYSDDSFFCRKIEDFANKLNIVLLIDPDLNTDPELDSSLSEFQDAYEKKSRLIYSEYTNKYSIPEYNFIDEAECERCRIETEEIIREIELEEELREKSLKKIPDVNSEYVKRWNEIINKLIELSEQKSFKIHSMSIMVSEGKLPWSYSFEFSDEEYELANVLHSELDELESTESARIRNISKLKVNNDDSLLPF